MEKVDIIDLVRKLTDKTEKGQCMWLDISGGVCLYLRSGSINFIWSYDEMLNGYDYTMKLFDTTEQFDYYHVDMADDYDGDQYHQFDKLREAVVAWKAAVRNAKIKSLFDEL